MALGTAHSAHADMPANAVLADDCDRCREHAEHPFVSLDDSHLERLHVIATMYLDTGRFPVTITTNDYIAASKVVEVISFYNRLDRVHRKVLSLQQK